MKILALAEELLNYFDSNGFFCDRLLTILVLHAHPFSSNDFDVNY